MWNARLDEAQPGNKIAGGNINNLRYADDTTLMAGSEEELKSLLMKVKAESEKAGLKLNIQTTKIMAPGPITSWQIDGETIETRREFTLGGSKITADCDWSREIKRCLLLGRKAVTNLDSILKSRDITLPTKVHLVKTMVFPVVTYKHSLRERQLPGLWISVECAEQTPKGLYLTLSSPEASPLPSCVPGTSLPAEVSRRLHSREGGFSWGPQPRGSGYLVTWPWSLRPDGRVTIRVCGANETVQV